MNPFKFDPEKKLQRDLDAARSTRDKLSERLKVAEAAAIETKAAAQKLARDGADDTSLNAAEATQRAAEVRVGTKRKALAAA